MSTTKTLKVNQNFDRLLKCRANGYYDYVDVVIPTKDTKDINIEMQKYDGLKYIFNTQGGKGTTIIDFSDTVLPWKFEMNNYLARTRYCWKPYREEPYQVEILKQVPSNYNIVGTPTFNGNVVSGFSSSNYLTLKKPFKPQGAWEIVLKFKMNEAVGREQGLFGYNGTGLFKICLGGNNRMILSLSTVDNDWNIGEITGTTDVELNKFYWAKIEFTGTTYKLSLSTNGADYNLEGTLETSSIPVFPDTTCLGVVNRNYNSLAGSIDLSESHVLIDGTKYNLSDAAYVKQWNLNKVGDVQVSDDGVISNFSSSNYASVNNVHINTEEDLLLVFRTSDDVSNKQAIFRSSTNALELYIESNGHMGIWNNSQREEVFLTNASPNTEYYVKFRFLEDNNIEVGLSLNGSNYEWHSFRDTTLVYTDTAEYDIGKHTSDNSWYFRGTFDYNKSDIPQTGGKLKTEELYGILDIDGDINIQKPLCYYVNKDQNIIIRQTKNITMDTSNWYLGYEDLYVDNMPHYNPLV